MASQIGNHPLVHQRLEKRCQEDRRDECYPKPVVGNHRPRVDGFSGGIVGNRVKRHGLEHESQCHIYERRIERENGDHRRRRETENALKVRPNHIVSGSEDIEDVAL